MSILVVTQEVSRSGMNTESYIAGRACFTICVDRPIILLSKPLHRITNVPTGQPIRQLRMQASLGSEVQSVIKEVNKTFASFEFVAFPLHRLHGEKIMYAAFTKHNITCCPVINSPLPRTSVQPSFAIRIEDESVDS